MTDDISRRGFLKGLMAAAAIATVAPQLLAAETAPDIVAAVLPVTVEAGDLWLKLQDEVWRFIGKVTSFGPRNVPDLTEFVVIGRSLPRGIPAPENEFDLELVCDFEGDQALREACFSGDGFAMRVGGPAGAEYAAERVYVMGYQLDVDQELIRISTSIQLGSPMMVSFPKGYLPA